MHRRHNTSTVGHHHIDNETIDWPSAGQGTLGPTQSRIVKVSIADQKLLSFAIAHWPLLLHLLGPGRLAKGVGEPPGPVRTEVT